MLRRVLGMFFVIVGGSVFLYCAWTTVRFSGPWPTDWPRSFPYPDTWLVALNNYYDAKYPVIGRYVKIHDEWPRVMRDVFVAKWSGGVVCATGLVMLLLPLLFRIRESRRTGFEVIQRARTPHAIEKQEVENVDSSSSN